MLQEYFTHTSVYFISCDNFNVLRARKSPCKSVEKTVATFTEKCAESHVHSTLDSFTADFWGESVEILKNCLLYKHSARCPTGQDVTTFKYVNFTE